jgi:hypothetical protein
MCYFAGSNAQAGVPAGNRKLGAMARIIAKVDRCGVLAIPTPKSSNRKTILRNYLSLKKMHDGNLFIHAFFY